MSIDKAAQELYDDVSNDWTMDECRGLVKTVAAALVAAPTVQVLRGTGRMAGQNFLAEAYSWSAEDVPHGTYRLLRVDE